MEEENRVLESYLDAQLVAIGQATSQLARTMWAYYGALREQGFNDFQALEMVKDFQVVMMGLAKKN